MASTSILVQAPPERVWDLVTDVTRMGEWSPETVAAEWLDGATAAAAGARFKGRNKRRGSWSTKCTVTESERGQAFSFEVGRGETRWSYRFSPDDGGCRVTESFEIVRRPGPVGRWLTKLGTGVTWAEREADLVGGMEETLRRLKAAAESKGSSA
jgi:uncharacterized protein YndB with AHSA1/START domain